MSKHKMKKERVNPINNSKAYEAKALRNKIEGKENLRSIEQIVKDIVLGSDTELK